MTTESKVIIITGATSGIGRATAILAVEHGHRVVLGARHETALEELAATLNQTNPQHAVYHPTDVTNRQDVQRLVQTAVDAFGQVDVLDNNAGIMQFGPLAKSSSSEWDEMIDVNIKGVLYGIEAVLPVMHTQGFGQIIATDSTAGHQVGENNTVYASTKFAVQAIMNGLRLEEANHHIRTMMVSPAFTETNFFNQADAKPFENQPHLKPGDVAAAVLYAVEQPANVDVNEIVLHPTL